MSESRPTHYGKGREGKGREEENYTSKTSPRIYLTVPAISAGAGK